jgi:hypothetical protein
MDIYASWAATYQIPTIFTFNTLNVSPPQWMLNLVGGSANLLEYNYFTGNVNSQVTTSIRCLWQAMASRYASNPYIIFDMFNEPFNGNRQSDSGGYVTPSNYRTVESGYSNAITSLVDAVRAINPNQIILVDNAWTVFYDIAYGTIPIDIPRSIIWQAHAYAGDGYNDWKYYIDHYVQFYVTNLGKMLFIGEYGVYPDNQGIESSAWTDPVTGASWQSTLSSMVAYLKTKPLWGYSWWIYGSLYGKWANTEWASEGYTVFSASDSTWILNTVLH